MKLSPPERIRDTEFAGALAIPLAGFPRADMGADVAKVKRQAGEGIRYTMEPILATKARASR